MTIKCNFSHSHWFHWLDQSPEHSKGFVRPCDHVSHDEGFRSHGKTSWVAPMGFFRWKPVRKILGFPRKPSSGRFRRARRWASPAWPKLPVGPRWSRAEVPQPDESQLSHNSNGLRRHQGISTNYIQLYPIILAGLLLIMITHVTHRDTGYLSTCMRWDRGICSWRN